MNRRAHVAAIAAATALAYLNSFRGVFQFDDYRVIVNNPVVHTPGAWLADLGHGIRPLLKLTYMANWVVGPGVFGFHAVNLGIHVVNGVLVYFLCQAALRPLRPACSEPAAAALAAALLFALHPAQTEAVTYVCGRSTSLMATFYLGALLCHARGSETEDPLLLHAATPLLFVLALLAKETAVTLPAALLLWEKAFGPGAKGMFRRQAVCWILLLCASAALIAHPGYGRLLESCFDVRSVASNLRGQIGGIAYLASRLFALNGMNIDPDLPVPASLSVPLAVAAAGLAASLVAGVLLLKKVPWLGFGLLWFFLHLLPTNSVVPRLDVANERQLYLAGLGVFLPAAVALDRASAGRFARHRWARAACIGVLALLAVFTGARNRDYRSEVALWEDAARKSPRKARVHNNLGFAYQEAGERGKARKEYLAALSLDPDYALARRNLDALSR